jgi:hypothetical protein
VIAADNSRNANEALATLGSAGYFLGAPIVHFAHGNVGAGLGSLAIRGGSFGVAILGFASCWGNNSDVCGLMVFGLLGMVAAIPIDAAVLAYEEDEYEDEEDGGPDEETSLGPFRRLSLAPVFGSALSHREGVLLGGAGSTSPSAAFDGLVLTGAF